MHIYIQVITHILRGYGYRRQGIAGWEGKVQYRHQIGGQEHTGQLSSYIQQPMQLRNTRFLNLVVLTNERIRTEEGDAPEKIIQTIRYIYE